MIRANVHRWMGTTPRFLVGNRATKLFCPSPKSHRVPKATGGKDFDQLLIDFANSFEKADNKSAIVGWGVAALSALIIAEWLMHLPLFNILVGFPVQLLGLIMTPYLVIRYSVEKSGDPASDIEMIVGKVTDKLPGLK